MKKQFDDRVRVTVYLEKDKYEAIKERSGLTPVSALCRHLLDVYMDGEFDREGAGLKAPAEAPIFEQPAHHPRCPCAKCVKKREGKR